MYRKASPAVVQDYALRKLPVLSRRKGESKMSIIGGILWFALGLGIPIFQEWDVEGRLRQEWMRHRLAQPREEEM